MKFSTICAALCVVNANAFSPSLIQTNRQSTSLNLFGGKKSGGDDAKKGGPNMMDQLAMFKKAQEISSKKKVLDDELAEMDIIGKAADGKVKITVKYLPAQMPMSPSPGYDVAGVDIDEEYLNDTSAEDLSAALMEAIRDGENSANLAVTEKYKVLEADLGGIMGGLTGAKPE
uniref:Uncharacterized protein n=1 Tax=Eucampia antarctica TaxID=49252 RepID=A0A7S2RHR3_9STRA|mmetsp:Transcript_22396/g.21529  ORF Transcript_22396/g.21529 Transcript_22396/m.21529 type:complete len:173 (+) Transcript_22396:40-558(+)|eukprot:CAMPEP_0197831420 /NCGR_PEP_ID=MMETSP1437-20131217/10028_1 /TAXON_ID=49252 ORGANISM="Eucampia antarctica, Strain CCMP1452" /NCGR_SAMPLE_ID=MMETSP1437 /ASSEMBLY_ACC=CAM_ASM_001096 /LENGTH=172 /DNA_ID=CAMNT_0043434325 /DNA_START=36 /DNA_END=554 /DNA_ORIENTATION=-